MTTKTRQGEPKEEENEWTPIFIAIFFVAGMVWVFSSASDDKEISSVSYTTINNLAMAIPELTPVVKAAMEDQKITKKEYDKIWVEYEGIEHTRVKEKINRNLSP